MSVARKKGEEGPTLLEVLARAPAAPAAAVIIFSSLKLEDRKALRLAHPLLRDAVDASTTKLRVAYQSRMPGTSPAAHALSLSYPLARRWPRLEALSMRVPNLAAVEALSSEAWSGLRSLSLDFHDCGGARMDQPIAHAVAAALRCMPALRALEFKYKCIPLHGYCWAENQAVENQAVEVAGELFSVSTAEATPHLTHLTLWCTEITPAVAGLLAAGGWRIQELRIYHNNPLGDAGFAALAASPSFALRRLVLCGCALVSPFAHALLAGISGTLI